MWTREYATPPARNWIATASHGLSRLTAVANANAEAECPDGNDDDVGILTCRAPGTPAPERSGLPRPDSVLTPRFTRADVKAIARTPRLAERLPAGPVSASAQAMPSQSRDRSADLDSRRMAWSSAGAGTLATAT